MPNLPTVPCLLLIACAGVLASADPQVTTYTLDADAAPRKQTQDHGRVGQNARVRWWSLAPCDISGGMALYGSTEPMRTEPDGSPAGAPQVFRVDLVSGKVFSYGKKGKLLAGQPAPAGGKGLNDADEGADPFAGMGNEGVKRSEPVSTAWEYAPAQWAMAGRAGEVIFAAEDGQLVRYDLKLGGFQKFHKFAREKPLAATSDAAGSLYLLTEDGWLHQQDTFGFARTRQLALPKGGRVTGLALDRQGAVYVSVEGALGAVLVADAAGKLTPLVQQPEAARVRLYPDRQGQPYAAIGAGDRETRFWSLHDGEAAARERRPDFDLDVDFMVDPAVRVRPQGKDELAHHVWFEQAAWDRVKCLAVSPDGRTVYGAGWPTAWIWTYDVARQELRRRGRDYVWYEMIPEGDEVFAIGYYGIKLLRWKPMEPWTFDETTHYGNKKPWPQHQSPFGDRSSNPRLVARFRYFQHLNIRRPSGFARGSDGCFYTGAKNAGYLFYLNAKPWGFTGTRYCGALCWYDPASETIGLEREPFVNHEVTDVCSALGGRYIVAAAKRATNPYDPPPEQFPSGKLVVFDTVTRRFVHQSTPSNGSLWYVEEATPGLVVGAANAGDHAKGDPDVGRILFVFDVRTMQYTRIIRIVGNVIWNTYDASSRFQRGPDQHIYFYGTDTREHTALFRLDAQTGAIEPVFREDGVTDHKTYINPGAPFAFAVDRVYFGTGGLRSLPLGDVVKQDIIAPTAPQSQSPTPSVERRPTAAAPAAVAVTPGVPPLQPQAWRCVHEIVWRQQDGPRWYSIGHTATALLVEPAEDRGSVTLKAVGVGGFDDNLPSATRLQPLGDLTLRADDPEAGKPKRGLHRRRDRFWDFNFGWLPADPYTMLQRLYFARNDTFTYSLIVHAAGKADAGRFTELRLYVLVCELLDESRGVNTMSWPADQPMPRGDTLSTTWYDGLAVRPPWALGKRPPSIPGPPIASVTGPLTVAPDGAPRFGATSLFLDPEENDPLPGLPTFRAGLDEPVPDPTADPDGED